MCVNPPTCAVKGALLDLRVGGATWNALLASMLAGAPSCCVSHLYSSGFSCSMAGVGAAQGSPAAWQACVQRRGSLQRNRGTGMRAAQGFLEHDMQGRCSGLACSMTGMRGAQGFLEHGTQGCRSGRCCSKTGMGAANGPPAAWHARCSAGACGTAEPREITSGARRLCSAQRSPEQARMTAYGTDVT
jgi:hypothetical protein